MMKEIRKILLTTISEEQMASDRSSVLTVLSIVLVIGAVYLVDPTFFGLLKMKKEGFYAGTLGSDANYSADAGQNDMPGSMQQQAETANQHIESAHAAHATRERKEEEEEGFRGKEEEEEGFAHVSEDAGPAAFDSSQGPAGCYPRDQLTPSELLPKDPNSVWAQQNPMGTGSLKGKNFLSAGALIGVNTVGQSLRNANYQLRSEPPNPQVPVSVFYNSTIEPDTNRRDLEIN
jgi:hypothetical protein